MFSPGQMAELDVIFAGCHQEGNFDPRERAEILEDLLRDAIQIGDRIDYLVDGQPRPLEVISISKENEYLMVKSNKQTFAFFLTDFQA